MRVRYIADHRFSQWVRLTDDEIDHAVAVGMEMRKLSRSRKQRDYRKDIDKPYDEAKAVRIQCLGAVAELAARKLLGYPMELVTENYRAADLPDNIEVRLIGVDNYGLRVHPRTQDWKNVMGVVIPKGKERGHAYRVPGWINAAQAKRQEWKMTPHNGPPMYAVPQSSLLPIDSLPTPSVKEKTA